MLITSQDAPEFNWHLWDPPFILLLPNSLFLSPCTAPVVSVVNTNVCLCVGIQDLLRLSVKRGQTSRFMCLHAHSCKLDCCSTIASMHVLTKSASCAFTRARRLILHVLSFKVSHVSLCFFYSVSCAARQMYMAEVSGCFFSTSRRWRTALSHMSSASLSLVKSSLRSLYSEALARYKCLDGLPLFLLAVARCYLSYTILHSWLVMVCNIAFLVSI